MYAMVTMVTMCCTSASYPDDEYYDVLKKQQRRKWSMEKLVVTEWVGIVTIRKIAVCVFCCKILIPGAVGIMLIMLFKKSSYFAAMQLSYIH